MFALKKLLSAGLQPYSVLFAVILAGLILLRFSKRQRLAKVLLVVGFALLTLSSSRPVAHMIAGPLEAAYPPFLAGTTQAGESLPDGSPAPRWVVVLGGGHSDSSSLAPLQALSTPALVRLAEGIRLQRLLPGSKLVLSGGNPHGKSEASIMAAAAVSLGSPPDCMVLEPDSLDTIDEVRALRPILGQDRFALVTSATHLPRAMVMFKKAGMNPIPAPTEFLISDDPWTIDRILGWIPHPGPGVMIERSWHEYLGIAWAKLHGQAH
ncbi:MAG TPA: ElyC/SanA/YdcF family protein [Polyangia bacterium]